MFLNSHESSQSTPSFDMRVLSQHSRQHLNWFALLPVPVPPVNLLAFHTFSPGESPGSCKKPAFILAFSRKVFLQGLHLGTASPINRQESGQTSLQAYLHILSGNEPVTGLTEGNINTHNFQYHDDLFRNMGLNVAPLMNLDGTLVGKC